MCHLNVHVALSAHFSEVRVLLATDSCEPRLRIGSIETAAIVKVEPGGIAGQIIRLPDRSHR